MIGISLTNYIVLTKWKKYIQNVDLIICKLGLASIKTTNHKLEDASKKKQKREKITKRWKAKARAAKHHKAKKEISLFSIEKKNYKSNIKDDTNWDQANNKYPI